MVRKICKVILPLLLLFPLTVSGANVAPDFQTFTQTTTAWPTFEYFKYKFTDIDGETVFSGEREDVYSRFNVTFPSSADEGTLSFNIGSASETILINPPSGYQYLYNVALRIHLECDIGADNISSVSAYVTDLSRVDLSGWAGGVSPKKFTLSLTNGISTEDIGIRIPCGFSGETVVSEAFFDFGGNGDTLYNLYPYWSSNFVGDMFQFVFLTDGDFSEDVYCYAYVQYIMTYANIVIRPEPTLAPIPEFTLPPPNSGSFTLGSIAQTVKDGVSGIANIGGWLATFYDYIGGGNGNVFPVLCCVGALGCIAAVIFSNTKHE